MNISVKSILSIPVIMVVVSSAALSSPVVASFGPEELIGVPGLYGSATAEISIYETTATGGTIDFALTNTSFFTELEPGKYANAFITEFQFDLPDNFDLVTGDSSVIAEIGVRFAQGAGNPVVPTLVERTLDWDYGNGTGGGPFKRDFEASQNDNANAIFSGNALDPSGIPLEDYATGFLDNGNWEGAAFDSIIFRAKVENSRPITDDDLAFYECGDHLTLTLKFQGGGDGSAWVPNDCTVPEPSALLLLIVAIPAALRARGLIGFLTRGLSARRPQLPAG